MSRVLVDTSVWIDFFKDPDSPYGAVLDQLLQQRLVCITHVIRAEIIPSAPTRKQFQDLMDYFGALPTLREPETLWDEMIYAQYDLKRKGIHGVSIPDLIIAVTARAHNREIYSKDSHFRLMKKSLGLRLFEPTGR